MITSVLGFVSFPFTAQLAGVVILTPDSLVESIIIKLALVSKKNLGERNLAEYVSTYFYSPTVSLKRIPLGFILLVAVQVHCIK